PDTLPGKTRTKSSTVRPDRPPALGFWPLGPKRCLHSRPVVVRLVLTALDRRTAGVSRLVRPAHPAAGTSRPPGGWYARAGAMLSRPCQCLVVHGIGPGPRKHAHPGWLLGSQDHAHGKT